MAVEAGLDSGPMLWHEATPLASDETGETLHDRLAKLAPVALEKALPAILDGNGPRFIALQVEPTPPTFSAATPQQDWKDWHFHRMHREARDLIAWIAQSRREE